MRRPLFALFVALLSWPVNAQAPTEPVPVSYAVEGTNPDGSTYSGRAEYVEYPDGVVSITYFNPNDQVMSIAFGLRDGDRLATMFQAGQAFGAALFTAVGESWVGKWTAYGLPGVFAERLTKIDPKLHGAERGPKSAI